MPALRKLTTATDDFIAAIEGVTDQFEPQIARLQVAVTTTERVLKGGVQ
jgi:hypothetical protein